MSKGKQRPALSLNLGHQPGANPTLADWDQAFHGQLRELDAGNAQIELLDIFSIYPSAQPRHAIPSAIYAQWDGDTAHLGEIFQMWVNAILDERSAKGHTNLPALDPRSVIELKYIEQPMKPGPLERSLMNLLTLAADIYREDQAGRPGGLINYPTVLQNGMIETGERRWLAYHALHNIFGEKWVKIPCRIVEQFSVWRQASENNVRENLNAIAKARQFAILFMSLHPDTEWQPASAFEHEHGYYAQALSIENVPYGYGEQLRSAMGFKSRAEFMRCRDILGLSDAVWTLADDNDTPQAVLLRCVNLDAAQALALIESYHDGTIYKQANPPTLDIELKRFVKSPEQWLKKADSAQRQQLLRKFEQLISMLRQ